MTDRNQDPVEQQTQEQVIICPRNFKPCLRERCAWYHNTIKWCSILIMADSLANLDVMGIKVTMNG